MVNKDFHYQLSAILLLLLLLLLIINNVPYVIVLVLSQSYRPMCRTTLQCQIMQSQMSLHDRKYVGEDTHISRQGMTT